MGLTNKFVIIAIILVVANYATGNFVFQQIGKAGESAMPYSGSIQCIIGAYMFSPTWNGIPIPSTDDIMFALITGLLILGLFSAANRRLTTKQKLYIFLFMWVLYRLIGYYLMTQIPGCLDDYATYQEVVSPLSPILLLLALLAVAKILSSRR